MNPVSQGGEETAAAGAAEGEAGGGSAAPADAARSGTLRQRARTALEMGDVANEFEGLLSESVEPDPVDVVPTVQAEAERVRERFRDVEVAVDAPLGEWAYCGGLFEPTCRALLRHAANCATATDGLATVRVAVTVEDDHTVSVAVSLDVVGGDGGLLTDGVGETATSDPESPEALSCWLGYWCVERLGGTVSVSADSITVDLPQVDGPGA